MRWEGFVTFVDMSEKSLYRGLNEAEVEESRRKHGRNVLTPPVATPLWRKFLDKFKDPLIIILLIAGVASIGISCYEYYVLHESTNVFFEPIGIFIAIFLATGLAFIFETKAENEFRILNKVNDEEPVDVRRGGNVVTIPRCDVVVGDVVILSTGDEVPADGRLLESVSLSVDESSLTGEPLCHKSADAAQADPDATFPTDRVLRGTRVMEGHGVMLVDAVGDATECGKVYEESHLDNGVKTPLSEQMERLGVMISRISYVIGVVVVIGRLWVYFANVEFDWVGCVAYILQTLMIAVTLIVVSVPEGLPMAVTLALAYSMRRMLKSNNLVRRLHACETMGAATVICTDKTGTLTYNRMTVGKLLCFPGPTSEEVDESLCVNSTAELDFSVQPPKSVGNPTECALLSYLNNQGKDYRDIRAGVKVIAEVPFSTERKYMAMLVERKDGSKVLYAKGAPERIMAHCCNFDAEQAEALLSRSQESGMRTLAFAMQNMTDAEVAGFEKDTLPDTLTLVGIAAISDPVRDDVADAVKEVTSAGVDVKIVTGDTPRTARAIAGSIGLWNDSCDDSSIVEGPQVAAMSDDELRERAQSIRIIARARPADKRRFVEALQSRGEVVAVTGDGTNDAPALKAAQVGLSMGDGTSVAKEASDITIIDNSFSSIVNAVVWGRSLFMNIRRFILFQMTVNVVACLVVMCGVFMGTQAPLTVTQMLWVNLIMDTFAAMALASLPPSRSVMKEKPRDRNDFIINRAMWRFILGVGGAMAICMTGFLYYLEHVQVKSLWQIGRVSAGGYVGLSDYELSVFFTVFVFLQFWNMFNARAFMTGRSAFHLRGCGEFLFIAIAIFIGQILIISFGGAFFNVEPLCISDWCAIILITSPVLWIGELLRLIANKQK